MAGDQRKGQAAAGAVTRGPEAREWRSQVVASTTATIVPS